MKIAEADDFDQIQQARGFFAADLEDLSVRAPPFPAKQIPDTLSLIIGARFQIRAISRAVDLCQAIFTAAGGANEPAKRRAGAFTFRGVAIDASRGHGRRLIS